MTQNLSDLAEAEARREAIRDSAAKFLRGQWSLAKLRECVEGNGVAHAPTLWREMQSLEWHRIEPFRNAGDGLGIAELCAIIEETGRAMAPTPLLPCVVGHTILRASGAGTLRNDAAFPVLAHVEAQRASDRLCTAVTASKTDTGYRLDGTKRFVPYGMHADVLIVNARQDDGTLALFAIEPTAQSIERNTLALLDHSPCAEVHLRGTEVRPAARIAAGDAAARLLGDALAVETLGRCAELVGVGARALDLAVDYAKQRVAFDRPIGSFQAVQHKLVDLRGHIEVTRALYQGAARAGSSHAGERDLKVSMAAFAALDELRKVPEGALQIFGGIGTTWEHDIHFFLRRAATLCALLGERAGFRETVARHLAAEH